MSGLLKFITCGSVDDGKSTLIGHILYDSKLLYADQEKALELDLQTLPLSLWMQSRACSYRPEDMPESVH